MYPTFKISKEDTLKLLKSYIEPKYGYSDSTITTKVILGCSNYRDYEPDRVEFEIITKKDLGLGIGESSIVLSIDEKEAILILKNKLIESDIQVNNIKFELITGYERGSGNSKLFDGTAIGIKTLEDLNIRKVKSLNR